MVPRVHRVVEGVLLSRSFLEYPSCEICLLLSKVYCLNSRPRNPESLNPKPFMVWALGFIGWLSDKTSKFSQRGFGWNVSTVCGYMDAVQDLRASFMLRKLHAASGSGKFSRGLDNESLKCIS